MFRGIFIFFFFNLHLANAQKESVGNVYNFYQNYISDIRPTKCPMYPSCSNFAMDSFKNYNVLVATLKTTDRLLRCGHEHKKYELVSIGDDFKLFDPAILNDEAKILRLEVERLVSKSELSAGTDLELFLKLIDEGHFSEAISEYYRITLLELKVDLKTLEYNYYRALFGLGEYEKVIFHYENTLDSSLRDDDDIMLKVGESWFKLYQFAQSLSFLDQSFQTKTNQAYLLEGLNQAHLDRFTDAYSSFGKVEASHVFYDYALRNKEISLSLQELKLKSPLAAGLLGVIPGLGYAYSGHLTTGISALILNGLLGYATYTSFNTGNTGVGILSGVFTGAFYFGSISGGAKAAKRTNEARKNRLKNKLNYSFN